MARCTICHTRIETGDEVTQCETCKQDYHATCWSEVGGCGTYGCQHAAKAEKPPPPRVVGMGWGDSKMCPACNQEIGSSLLACRCGARFPFADPMSPREYDEWCTQKQQVKSSKSLIVFLFICTIIGFPAPVTGPAAGLYAHSKRASLVGQNGTFLALGYGAAALGGVYALILALLGLGM